ncbi:hypothetical protein FRC03_001310 [Tulasnella sp. 419]|nr:hypothetical protein FRC03_001310 [Tulasnella sp. 419]
MLSCHNYYSIPFTREMFSRVLITLILSILTCNQLVLSYPLGQSSDAQSNTSILPRGGHNRFPGTTAGYNLLKCSHLKAEETLQVKEEELTKLTKSEVNSGYRGIHGKSKKITRAEKDVELAAAAADKAKDELEEFKWTYPEIAARLEREETQFHCSYSRLYTHRQDYK